MQRAIEGAVSRAEFDELRKEQSGLSNRHDELTGNVFANTAAISLLVGVAVRRRAEAAKWTERTFLEYLSTRDELIHPLARRKAVSTFRGFVEDAQAARTAVLAEPRRRGFLRRLFG